MQRGYWLKGCIRGLTASHSYMGGYSGMFVALRVRTGQLPSTGSTPITFFQYTDKVLTICRFVSKCILLQLCCAYAFYQNITLNYTDLKFLIILKIILMNYSYFVT